MNRPEVPTWTCNLRPGKGGAETDRSVFAPGFDSLPRGFIKREQVDTSAKTVCKARKQHSCTWCNEKIQPGEIYEYWTCFGEGTAWRIKVHPECLQAWQIMLRHDPYYYANEVGDHEHQRGCGCYTSDIECGGKCLVRTKQAEVDSSPEPASDDSVRATTE